MDQGERTPKERNPREKASIFSIIFFCFTAPILKKGRKRDLQERDVYEILPKFQSERLGNKLEENWNARKSHRAKSNKDVNQNGVKSFNNHKSLEDSEVSIFRCLLSRFGCYYLCLGLLQLTMRTALIILQPRAISKFVAYFESGQTTISKREAYGYAFFVIGINLINCIYNHNYQQLIMEYSVRVRTSLCSLIYRKALKLSPVAFSENSMGKVVTLITKDVYSIDGAMTFFNDMWIGVIQTVLITVMIYRRVGASVFVGIGFFVMMIPIQSYCGRKFSLTRLIAAKKAEQRIQLVKEALNAIKIIKMYTWEKYFEKLINVARMSETDKLKIIYYLKATIVTLGGLTMKLAFFLLIITYTLVGKTVTAETVYFVQQCFVGLRSCITTSIPMGISSMAELCAAMKRFQQYLNAPEYIPQSSPKTASAVINPKVYLNKVSVKIQDKEIIRSVSMDLEKGLLIVSGNIGSGKSSLLKTILNEYPISGGKKLVRGSVSYAPEEPWLFPSTIRQNILFGQPYNTKRYQEVLNVCALTHDLNQFEKLDHTVVGDKGINLSKGQQARICLARAVYKDSDIYLLDDCLSALDGHVNNHVFRECIRGFLKDKLVILINNNINNIKQVATGSVLYMENGKTLDLEQQKAALDKRITYFIDEDNQHFYDDYESDQENSLESDRLLKEKDAIEPRRNLYHEENKQGAVLWKNYVAYYKYTGGIAVLLFTLVLFTVCQAALAYSEKLLSVWVNIEPTLSNLYGTNQTEEYDATLLRRNKVLHLYTVAILVGTGLSLLRSFSNFYFCTRAGRKLHKVLVVGVMNACMPFYDKHYVGNIVNRVSKDFYTIDENIPFIIYENLRSFFVVLGTIVLIASVNYFFLIPAAILFTILFFIQRYYIPTGRSLKRLEAATRSPMIGYINASLEGLTTVHASQEEKILQHEFDRHQDFFTSAYYMSQCSVRAFAFSMDMMCIAFISCIVLKFAIFSDGVKAGHVGLAVTQAMTLTGLLQWAIRQAAEMENTMTSVERVLEYANAESENRTGQEVPGWPKTGEIDYSNVSLTYKTTGERVLKGVNFKIAGGSKIGIVGRTGAGKTSIISVLFRLYDYEGAITIDGVNIRTLPLEVLRSKIGIIPQDPILFTGTIRSNIDPLHQYSDSEIWTALEKVQMKGAIVGLNQDIADHGLNYSSGQRQLLCLARALVCKSKIIVLDEATASMDAETDRMIQKTMQENFVDCTVLTIAHRLNSFQVADKILVVDDGKISQFDSPNKLLTDEEGLFYRMVREDGGISFL